MARFEVGGGSESGSETTASVTAGSETASEGGTGGNGECAAPCNDGESCVMGVCVVVCLDPCDATLEICEQGVCVCRFGFTPCGGTCVDLSSDPMHCGDCGDACAVGVCDDSTCEPDCQESTNCDGVCVNLEDSPLHCGSCGAACTGDELCIESECVGYQAIDCRSDLDCDGGVCCTFDGEGKLCIDGDSCP